MLRSYSNQDDIAVGSPVANRHYSQIESLIGFFVNSLALRVKIDSKVSIKKFIQSIGHEVIEAQLHQDLPFEKIVDVLKIAKDTSRHPIFQVLFGVQSFGSELNQTNDQTDTNLSQLLSEYIRGTGFYSIAKLDISIYIDDSQVCLKGNVNYAVNLYTETTIKGFIETYTEILKQFIGLAKNSQEQAKITDLNYLNQEQYNQIIHTWNNTDKDYPSDKTIHELFEEQADKTPNNIAVVYEEESLTYKELNERANQLAHYLRNLGVDTDTLIAIVVERSLEMIIGLLGILKAGGAYVPMDPSCTAEYLQSILEDTQAPIILTDKNTNDKIPATFARVISLDEEWNAISKYNGTQKLDC
jgi:non-ribosomal peptide synthetase component F